LVGDPADAGSFPAFTQLTVPTRPYIDAVRPDVASSGAALDATIEIDVVNLGSETPVMRVNGQVVSYTTNVVGNVTTLTYTPAAPFRKAAGVNVELSYGNTTSSWNFFTTSGFKALVMGAEDPAIRERLAAVHKLDVTQTPEASVPRDATYLSQSDLELRGGQLRQRSAHLQHPPDQRYFRAAHQRGGGKHS
jgi:hypothetical protein